MLDLLSKAGQPTAASSREWSALKLGGLMVGPGSREELKNNLAHSRSWQATQRSLSGQTGSLICAHHFDLNPSVAILF